MAHQQPMRLDWTPDDGWRYQRFLETIGQQTGLDGDRAERAAMATLVTLAERIPRRREEELAEDLPEQLRTWLADATDRPERFHVEEFVRRVAEREEVGAEEAARHGRAVFRALARVAPAYEIDDLVDELPQEFEPFVGDVAREIAAHAEPVADTYSVFVELVKRRADLDFVEAERATEVVVELLAARLPGAELAQLRDALPRPFEPALARGAAQPPRRMSLDELVQHVAREERISFDEAFARTRAVAATLAEALPGKELRDLLHHLPRGYREALL